MTAVSALAVSAVLARLLQPSALGTYFLATSLAVTGAMIGNLGLHQTVQSTVAASLGLGDRPRARRLIEVIATIGVGCAIAAALLYLVLGRVIAVHLFKDRALLSVNVLVGAWIFFLAAQTLFSETLRAVQDLRMASVMAGALSGVLLAVSLLVLLVLRGSTDIRTAVAISVASAAVGGVAAGVVVAARARRLAARAAGGGVTVAGILGASWPQMVTVLAASRMSVIPLWIVSASAPHDQVALFGTASRVAFTVVLPFGLVTAVLPPIIAELWARRETARLEEVLRTVAGVVLLPVSLVSLVLLVFGGRLLSFAFGGFYGHGATALVLLVAGYWVNALAGACGEVLMMTGHQRTMMGVTLLSVAVLTAGCQLVVGPYGVNGVAAVTGASFVLQNALMMAAARRQCGLWTHADVLGAIRRLRSLPEVLRR
ncbi:MAG: hypothetical protein QOE35_641 [Actinomycetota bacterium]